MNFIKYIFYLSFISLISCGYPTFEIKGVDHVSTRCDMTAGFFEFLIKGKGKNIEDPIRITLPLKSPAFSKVVCMVSSIDMFWTIDVFLYDSKNLLESVTVYEEEPIFNNLKITNWADYFSPERRTINSAKNCKPFERIIDPEEEDELYIFGVLDENIDTLGCLKNKNNFAFQMAIIRPNNPDSEIYFEKDLNFEILFKKPKDEKISCIIPKNDIDGFYSVKCSMEYGDEIEIGAEANGIAYIGEKKTKITIRGNLLPPTIIDQCTDYIKNY